jgi:hypothetical protein
MIITCYPHSIAQNNMMALYDMLYKELGHFGVWQTYSLFQE